MKGLKAHVVPLSRGAISPPPQPVEATFCEGVPVGYSEASFQTRDRFVSWVCSGWSVIRAAAEQMQADGTAAG